MKQLYLIRHAKSDWNVASQENFERGLNRRGKSHSHYGKGTKRKRDQRQTRYSI